MLDILNIELEVESLERLTYYASPYCRFYSSYNCNFVIFAIYASGYYMVPGRGPFLEGGDYIR